jgi:hypothetical protein
MGNPSSDGYSVLAFRCTRELRARHLWLRASFIVAYTARMICKEGFLTIFCLHSTIVPCLNMHHSITVHLKYFRVSLTTGKVQEMYPSAA